MAEGTENRIAEVRLQKGLRQVELAEKMGVSRGQLANMESGTRKVDLGELRSIARILGCPLVDLLLPTDAPNQPSATEAAFLAEIRAEPGYDARAILAAVQGVLAACRGVVAAAEAPRQLGGDARLVRRFSETWNELDDPGREKAVALLDAAREFGR